MSVPKATIVAILLGFVEARFGVEQGPVQPVQALGAAGFGGPGVAETIAGSIPGALLAGAGPCAKLNVADQIIDELGTDPQVVAAAIGVVAAETNFNPFAVDVPFVCADPSLPVNSQLRGVIPLVDPAVDGSDLENANSKASLTTPFDATGLSQAEVMIAQGFTSLQAVQSDGTNVVLDGQNGGNAGNNGANNGGNAGGNNGNAGNGADAADDVDDDDDDDDNDACNGGNGAGNGAGNNTGNGGVAVDNVDFGLCVPTMSFVGGLNGRPADEKTFIPDDALVAEGQNEALNPNIITNRICDQLLNVCEANDAARAACKDAQAQIQALGTKDQTTADTWNSILGF